MEHIQGHTYHARRGKVKNAFRYGVDFVFSDLEDLESPMLLSRNRFNLWSLWDHKHGGLRGDGQGTEWFRNVLAERGFPHEDAQLLLLAQPSFLWFHFNPVSFWVALLNGQPCAIVAEVNNTFGHRHCYFCAHDNFRPIEKTDTIMAEKLMHVSPFQKVEGQYSFNFDISDSFIGIRISYRNGGEGVLATLNGRRRRATSRSLFWAALRRPLGAVRVVALIYWQALILWIKRAPFLKTPAPPNVLTSDSNSFQGKSQ
ncbi:MAG: DUF1365 domain-containing protein [Paracoccaceae bacterium]